MIKLLGLNTPALSRRRSVQPPGDSRCSTRAPPESPEHPLPQAEPSAAQAWDLRSIAPRSPRRVDVFHHDAQGLEVRLRRGTRRHVTKPINPIRKRNESHCVHPRSETLRRDTASTGERHKVLCQPREARYVPMIFERCASLPNDRSSRPVDSCTPPPRAHPQRYRCRQAWT